MANSELNITMTELLGLPVISLDGTVQETNMPAINAMICGLSDFGKNSFIFDLNRIDCNSENDLHTLAQILKSSQQYLKIHVVCSGEPRKKLREAGLDKRIHLYSTTNEIAILLKRVTSRGEI